MWISILLSVLILHVTLGIKNPCTNRGCAWYCAIRGKNPGQCSGRGDVIRKCQCTIPDGSIGGGNDYSAGPVQTFLGHQLKQLMFLPARDNSTITKVLSDPAAHGLNNAKNYRISSEGGELGAWHVWPQGSSKKSLELLGANDVLIVYWHGQYDTRGYGHRIQMYQKWSKMGFHVLTFDYQGYGDSTEKDIDDLSEDTVVADGINVLKWVSSRLDNNKECSPKLPNVLVWGHSLGTGIASSSLHKWEQLKERNLTVCGLVLEAPYNNMTGLVLSTITPFGAGHLLTRLASARIGKANCEFRTNYYLENIVAPVRLLHAKDDKKISYKLGETLYESAMTGGKENIKLKLFPKNLSYGHNGIYQDPELNRYIKELLESAHKQFSG